MRTMGTRAVMFAAGALLLISGLASAQDETAPASLALGQPAPLADTKMKNVSGKELSIAEVKGAKGTLVVFTCNHCPWAKAWHSRIVTLGNQSMKRGVGVIAINANDPTSYPEDDFATMQSNAKKTKMGFPYVLDATSGVRVAPKARATTTRGSRTR